ncbi:helix-turn-helix transcriptional regulator [Paraburkholderia sp. SOS3]|uniref:helix-turn-helix transcriptional regulator n=1 Tax=Paraburkholderia sp. SOS3 TaxID=1926494 RepID=UPI0012EB7CA8|nr:WYL domain-containing protein [Paraburkholderia sp. SOS3]
MPSKSKSHTIFWKTADTQKTLEKALNTEAMRFCGSTCDDNPLMGHFASRPFRRRIMTKIDSEILAVLPTTRDQQRWMTTPGVADAVRQLGVEVAHVKTVQRRLEALLEDGVVVYRRAGNTLEWQRKEGASGIAAKAGSMMGFDEALALQVLKRFAGRQIPSLVSSSLKGLFEVADERIARGSSHEGRRHANWHRKVAVVDGALQVIRPAIKEDVFRMVSQALFSERLLEIGYRARSNPTKVPARHLVMPLGLVEAAEMVYLVAKPPGKPVAAMYRLDRMESATVQLESFTYPRDFSLNQYVETERHFDFFPQGKAQVVLRFAGDARHAVIETPLSKDQIVESNRDGSITVWATVMLSDRLHWWIRAFGPYVEVLEPKQLRQTFASEAKRTHELYSSAKG